MKRSVKSTWTNFSSKLTTKERNTWISSSLDQTQTILWETGFNFWFSFGSYPITWLNPNPNARTLVKMRCARANCIYTSYTCVHRFSKTGPKRNELGRIITKRPKVAKMMTFCSCSAAHAVKLVEHFFSLLVFDHHCQYSNSKLYVWFDNIHGVGQVRCHDCQIGHWMSLGMCEHSI